MSLLTIGFGLGIIFGIAIGVIALAYLLSKPSRRTHRDH